VAESTSAGNGQAGTRPVERKKWTIDKMDNTLMFFEPPISKVLVFTVISAHHQLLDLIRELHPYKTYLYVQLDIYWCVL
jgi:hypothetical protein